MARWLMDGEAGYVPDFAEQQKNVNWGRRLNVPVVYSTFQPVSDKWATWLG